MSQLSVRLVRVHASQDRVDRLLGRLHGRHLGRLHGRLLGRLHGRARGCRARGHRGRRGSLLGSHLGSPGCHLVGIASQTASQATSAPSTAPCLSCSQEEGWTRQRQRIRCWSRGRGRGCRGRRGSLGSWSRGHSRHGRRCGWQAAWAKTVAVCFVVCVFVVCVFVCFV